MSELLQNWRAAVLLVGLPVILGLIGHFLAVKIVRKVVRRTGSIIDDSLVRHCYRPLNWLAVLVVIRLALPAALPGELPSSVSHILSLFSTGISGTSDCCIHAKKKSENRSPVELTS